MCEIGQVVSRWQHLDCVSTKFESSFYIQRKTTYCKTLAVVHLEARRTTGRSDVDSWIVRAKLVLLFWLQSQGLVLGYECVCLCVIEAERGRDRTRLPPITWKVGRAANLSQGISFTKVLLNFKCSTGNQLSFNSQFSISFPWSSSSS